MSSWCSWCGCFHMRICGGITDPSAATAGNLTMCNNERVLTNFLAIIAVKRIKVHQKPIVTAKKHQFAFDLIQPNKR